ncbi:UNVERIFIED_CONTAM: Yos1 family protein [Hammondia hammondi]|eukprot:XP_008889073.1 Yos1 family protein [Hammondia hammondi]
MSERLAGSEGARLSPERHEERDDFSLSPFSLASCFVSPFFPCSDQRAATRAESSENTSLAKEELEHDDDEVRHYKWEFEVGSDREEKERNLRPQAGVPHLRLVQPQRPEETRSTEDSRGVQEKKKALEEMEESKRHGGNAGRRLDEELREQAEEKKQSGEENAGSTGEKRRRRGRRRDERTGGKEERKRAEERADAKKNTR